MRWQLRKYRTYSIERVVAFSCCIGFLVNDNSRNQDIGYGLLHVGFRVHVARRPVALVLYTARHPKSVGVIEKDFFI